MTALDISATAGPIPKNADAGHVFLSDAARSLPGAERKAQAVGQLCPLSGCEEPDFQFVPGEFPAKRPSRSNKRRKRPFLRREVYHLSRTIVRMGVPPKIHWSCGYLDNLCGGRQLAWFPFREAKTL